MLQIVYETKATINAELAEMNITTVDLQSVNDFTTDVSLVLEVTQLEPFVADLGGLAEKVALAAGLSPSDVSITVEIEYSDFCVTLTKKKHCKSRKAKRWLGCKWARRNGEASCAVKNPYFEQSTPLRCMGLCCQLNKRSCRGTGVHARKWSRKYKMNPKKACKYTKDKSMQTKTPDGKCDQELHSMSAHKPNISSKSLACPFGWSSLRAR